MNICIVDRGRKIPAINYGGTERVIWGLGKELTEMGHHVTFLVPEGSESDFARVIIRDPDVDLSEQIPEDIDIVHLSYKPEPSLSKPYLVTMHGNPAPDEDLDDNMVFISKNHAARYNSTVFVHNGLSWEDYPDPKLRLNRDSYHFLGKASWKVKNAAGAIKIAARNRWKLHIIGGKKWTERNLKSNFFHLFNKNIMFHGFLDNRDKTKIMQRSKGLLFPVLWHEPFGLAVIESLYAGCAVFGTPNGSLQELITPEVGFTGNSTSEIGEAMRNFTYDPETCHRYAIENFNSKKMTINYLELYKKVLNGEQLNQTAPVFNSELNEVSEFK